MSPRALVRPLALAVTLISCRPAAEPLPSNVLPFASLATEARAIVETTAVDVGDPAARPRLERGWGPDESGPGGSFAWSGGETATLRFEVVEPRATTLALRGWSFPFPDGGGQRIAARWNGVELAAFGLGQTPETVRLAIAEGRLVAGENRLELVPERRLEAAGEPPWAAAWDAVRLLAGEPAPAPRISPAGELELPARSALAWTLDLPAGVWLAWEEVASGAETSLEIAVRREGEPERAERVDGPGRRRLTAGEPALIEVVFRALGASGAARVAGARLHRPPQPASPTETPTPPPEPPPNLVVYVVDTLRADHLGCYGYERPTSPRLDAFAREAVRWREARAQSSWTKPAMATLLTGHYPITHGADRRANGLAPEVETIGDALRRAGYETAFFTTNPTVTAKFGFDRGFDVYRYVSRTVGRRHRSVSSAEIHAEVVDWLARRDASRPFLLVVHTLDPHDPYLPGEPFRSRFAPGVDPQAAGFVRGAELAALSPAAAAERAREMRALYDAEIAANDASFGALVDELARRGLLERAAVVFTSDHGEEFFDHGGWRHASTLYEEVLRVPLLVRLPGGAHGGLVIDAPADQIDLAPTLFELAGVAVPAELPGGSWLPALGGGPSPESASLAWLETSTLSLASAVAGGWKRIENRAGWRLPLSRGPDELYHLAVDPAERGDLTISHPLRRRWLAVALASAAARHGRAGSATEVAIDPELDRALRALGYL